MTEQEALQQGTGFRKNSWRAFVYVLPFLRPHLRRMGLVCLIDISIVLLNLTVPWFGKTIVDSAFPQRDWGLAGIIAASIAGILLLVQALTGTRTYLYNMTEQLLQIDIRRKMYAHLQRLSLDTLDTIPVGQQQFRMTTDPDRIAHMLVRILPTATMLVEFALVLTAAIYVDPWLTSVVLVFLIPWTALFIGVTHIGRVLDRRRLHLCETRDAGILQAAASFAIIKSLGRARWEVRRNGEVSVALQRVANQGYLILVLFEFATQRLIPFLKSTTIYLMLARKVVNGGMTLGETVPMIAYLSRLTFPIERIVNFGCWIWQTMVSAERMMQVLETEPAIQDRPGATKLGPLKGVLALEKVSFDRPGIGRVIDGVSLDVHPGKSVAIVGPSGAGKSTLMGLALRLIDPLEGSVRIDGEDLRSVSRDSYLHQVGTVMQDTFIFGGSLGDNLRLSQPEATDEDLVRALHEVELGEWLASLPNGLDEDLEGGLALSVGQRQRLGIARALLRDSRLLLLDEPTSSLDPRTEREAMATIRRVSQGRAVLMVTHRLRTVEDFDEIVVLDRGRIVEKGTHAELIEAQGTYAELHALYASRSQAQLETVNTP